MIELEPEIMKLAEKAKDCEELKSILLENNIDAPDPELNELAWILDIPHGNNCPCCIAMFRPLRLQNESREKKDKPPKMFLW